MAPQQSIPVIDLPAWERSMATTLSLNCTQYRSKTIDGFCQRTKDKLDFYA
jgi:hypothetical protein